MSTTGEQAMADRLRDLEVEVARLGASLTTKIDGLIADLQPERRDVEARLRSLESRMQRAAGVAMAGGTVLGALAGTLVDWLASR